MGEGGGGKWRRVTWRGENRAGVLDTYSVVTVPNN